MVPRNTTCLRRNIFWACWPRACCKLGARGTRACIESQHCLPFAGLPVPENEVRRVLAQSWWWPAWPRVCASLAVTGFFLAGMVPFAAAREQRAFELVSPVDKNGGDIVGDGETTISATNGEAVTYSSRASFADTIGSGSIGQTQYLARRTEHGWTTRAITPAPARQSLQVFFGSTIMPWFSEDLERVVLWAYDLPAVTDDVSGAVNIYRESTQSRSLETLTVSHADPIGIFDFFAGSPWGVSGDARHVALVTGTRLLPDAPAGVPSVYEWHDGTLRLASVLPNGSAVTSGADVSPDFYRDTVSRDGSRIVFEADGQLYLRVGGATTAQVSKSESTIEVPAPQSVLLQAVAGDGRHVFFTTRSRLLDEDPNDDGEDLYRYTDSANPATDTNLTLISNADTGSIAGEASGRAVVGTSDDGTRVYFQDAGGKLFLWDHGIVRLVVAQLPRTSPDNGVRTRLEATSANPGASRVTPDGAHLAFFTSATTDGAHGLAGDVTNRYIAMYRYDEPSDTLTCCSCPTDEPVAADATVLPAATAGTTEYFLPGRRPRFLSADGRVFFSTIQALVPEDVNGVSDAYVCDATGVALVSSGEAADGAWFADASASGDDVFLVTRARLVPGDQDNLVDLYDARVGGGFPAPPTVPAPCQGENECRGALPAAPSDADVGSASLDEDLAATVRKSQFLVRESPGAVGFIRVLMVRVPAPGSVSWAGGGVRPGSRVIERAGTYSVRVVLSAKARGRLRRNGTYRGSVRLRFSLDGGSATTVTTQLRFKAKRSSKGR